MWLLTPRGFYSVVADQDNAENVLVRARTRGDLDALRDVLGDLEIQETPGRDYRWRASVRRVAWSTALVLLAAEIDYPNFKAEVHRLQGSRRAGVYGRVWGELLELQRPGKSKSVSVEEPWERRFPHAKEVLATEGGAVYVVDDGDGFWLIKDESALGGMLDEEEEDLLGMLVTVSCFERREDRDDAVARLRRRLA